MKKMVCEICNSQQIRKENGVFVCQECGTEYSVEDAKKLLKEIDNSNSNETIDVVLEMKNQNTDISGKEKLITLLYYWACNISSMPDMKLWFNYETTDPTKDDFWNIGNLEERKYFPKIKKFNSFFVYFSENDFGVDEKEISGRFYNRYDKNGNLYAILENEFEKTSEYAKVKSFFIEHRDYFCNSKTLGGETIPFGGVIGTKFIKPFYLENVIPKFLPSKIIDYMSFIYDEYGGTNSIPLFHTKNFGIFGQRLASAPSNVQNQFDDIIVKSKKCYNEFIIRHNKLMDYYRSKYEEICLIVKEIMDNCLTLEKELFLPIKYRSLSTILTLIDMLKDGKATTWKELINLYDTQKFREGVYEKLDVINNKLDNIQNTLIAGFNAVINGIDNVKSQLSSINSKMNLISNAISKIKQTSIVTMWNTL